MKKTVAIVMVTAVITVLITLTICTLFNDSDNVENPTENPSESSENVEQLSQPVQNDVQNNETLPIEQQELIDEVNEKVGEGFEVVGEINGVRYEHAPGYEIVITEDTVTRFDVFIDYSSRLIILKMKEEYIP